MQMDTYSSASDFEPRRVNRRVINDDESSLASSAIAGALEDSDRGENKY